MLDVANVMLWVSLLTIAAVYLYVVTMVIPIDLISKNILFYFMKLEKDTNVVVLSLDLLYKIQYFIRKI